MIPEPDLLAAAGELCGGKDVGDGAEAMEQHGHELDDQDEGKEEHKHQTDRLQLQVLLADEDLPDTIQVIDCPRHRCRHSTSVLTHLPHTKLANCTLR